MAVTATAHAGVTLKFDDGNEVKLHEGDIVEGLVYQSTSDETVTYTGRVRVINISTRANNGFAQSCPPEPYSYRYITVGSMILDLSSEFIADLVTIDVSKIVSIDNAYDPSTIPPEGTIVVGPGSGYKDLNEAIADAEEGTTISLLAGTYESNLTINKSVTIIGPKTAVITGVIKLGEGIQAAPNTAAVTTVAAAADSETSNDPIDVVITGVTLSGNAKIEVGKVSSFTMTNCDVSGLIPTAKQDYVIKFTGDNETKVVIEDNVFGANSACTGGDAADTWAWYNGIEGNVKMTDGSSICRNTFATGFVTHNAVNIYNAADGATIAISGNHFGADVGHIRVGVKGTPQEVSLMFEDNHCEPTSHEWGGLVLFQPYGTQTKSMAGITARLNRNVNPDQALVYLSGGTALPSRADVVPTIYIDDIEITVPGPECMERSVSGWEKGWCDPNYQNNLNAALAVQNVSSATSFKEALASGGKVRLTAPITLTEKLTVTSDVTIDLNDQGLIGSGATGVIVASGANVTLKGNGTFKNDSYYALQATKNGTITIEKGVTIESGEGAAAAAVVSGATLVLNGGTIRNTNSVKKPGIQAQSQGNVVINDGVVEGTDYGIKALSGSNVTVNGGGIKGATSAIYSSNANYTTSGVPGGKIMITGGTIECMGAYGVTVFDNVVVNVTGGSIKAICPIITNGTAGNEVGVINISGGKVEGAAYGIYLPNGTLTISNKAEIIGPSGIVVRGGVLKMTGGCVTGTGTDSVKAGDVSYTVPNGAIVIDKNSSYTGGKVKVDITGGTITGAKAIVYTENGEEKTDRESYDGISISGATISGTKFGK